MTEEVNVCCGGLELLAKDYGYPFHRPLKVEKDTHNLVLGGWSVKLFKLTPAGNISKRSMPSLVLNFCPICGADLRGDKDSDEEGEGDE